MINFSKVAIYLFLLIAFTMLGCINHDDNINFISKENIIIDIKTTRTVGNILGANSYLSFRPSKLSVIDSLESTANSDIKLKVNASDPFTEIREVECFESVVLPELQPHIWIGNILTKSSVVDCNYIPLIYPRNPITVSSTLPGMNSHLIENPSFSKYLNYIQSQIPKGNFEQSGEFNFTIEQFTSYNELKVAFGSNVNTAALFKKSNSSIEGGEHTISKATGLYVKFYQTSFKIVMDYPHDQIASIPSHLINESVYVNSITYGRLGILTIETNEVIHKAESIINNTFRKFFTNGSSSLSVEEIAFLDGCDFHVYLIGGNGSTSVETFKGYSGFIQHIKNGTFSKNEPGTPLFCTFNNVNDNSPLSIKFKYSIKKEPIFLELKWRMRPSDNPIRIKNKGDLIVNFYRNRAKIPTIAPPNMKIKIRLVTLETGLGAINNGIPTNKEYIIYNTEYKTSMVLLPNQYTTEVIPARREGSPREGWRIEHGYTIHKNYLLLESNEYAYLGYNPIDESNAQYAIP